MMIGHINVGAVDAKYKQSSLKLHRADESTFSRSAAAVFVLGVMVFVAARVWHLTDYSLGTDEIFSLQAARQSWPGLIDFVAWDIVHPPLFYLLLKLWILLGGESLLWLRLFPLLTSILAIIPFFLLCRELKLRSAEMNLALLLMAVNEYLVFTTQVVRMYSLVLLLTLCSLWLFVRFFNSADAARKHLLALFVVNLLLIYTQYYGWLVVGVEWVFIMLWGRSKLLPFAASVGGLLLCFSPWAYVVAEAAAHKGGLDENLDWMGGPPHLDSLVWYYATLNGTFRPHWKGAVGVLLFGFPVALWGWQVLTGKQVEEGEDAAQRATFWWLTLLAFVPVAMIFAVSQILPQSVWQFRYLIIAAAPYMLLVSIAVYRLPSHWLRTATLVAFVGWAAVAGFKTQNEVKRRSAWEPLVQQMIQAEPPQADGVLVYVKQPSVVFMIWFYLEEAGEKRFQVQRIEDINDVRGDHFWVALRRSDEHKILTENGYQVGEGFTSSYGDSLFPVWRR